MKKIKFLVPLNRSLKKLLLTMKLCLLFLLISAASLMANSGYSQNTTLSIHLKNATLRDLISEVEKQSEFIFVYYDKAVDLDRKIDVQVENQTIDKVLDKIFKSSELTYRIFDRQIGLGKRNPVTGAVELPTSLDKLTAADKKTISGTVKDSKGVPLPGVTVVVKGTTIGTIADAEGQFRLSVPFGSKTLVFSFVGMKTQEAAILEKTIYNIVLEETTEGLDEVVVVGYGQQKKVSTVASISQIQGDALTKIGGVTNVSEQLQGLLPGVTVLNNSSRPGFSNSEIFIRGKASWVSTSILSLVDGVERDFNDVDPNEIETISVLKDASATSVYGVKGANGVILITTKRGSLKEPQISFESSYGWKDLGTKPGFSDYATSMNMWNAAAANDKQWSKLIPQSKIDAWSNAIATGSNGPYNPYFPEVDWWDQIIKTGTSQKYNINIRGGTEFVKYFASLGYLDDGDIFKTQKNDLFDPSFGYKRYNWRTNFDFNLTRTSVLSVNLSGYYGFRNQTGYQIDNSLSPGETQSGLFFSSIYNASRNTFPIRYDNGYFGLDPNGGGNLFAQLDLGQRLYKSSKNYLDVVFKQELDFITKGLNFHTRLSYNTESGTLSNVQKYNEINFGSLYLIGYNIAYDYSNPLPGGGYGILSSQRWPATFQGTNPKVDYDLVMQGGYQKKLFYEFGFDYARNIGGHNFTMMALMNRMEDSGLKSNSSTAIQFPENAESWVSRITYNWKERYLAELNGAYTGSQKFAPGKRFGFFPSYALGWRVLEEPFVKNLIGTKIINNIKVRYSSGVIGYDESAPAYTYVQIYNNAGGGVSFGDVSKYTYGPLYKEGAAANPNATWETAYKQNLGFDIDIVNKLKINLDLFKEKREGILMSVATPGWFGIAEPTGNIGKTKNHGYEIELTWNDKIGKSLNYWLKANYTFSENRVVYQNDPIHRADYLKYAGKPINVQNKLIVAGYYNSLDDIYNGATANNVTTQSRLVPGDFMYVDYNADGKIQDSDDQVPVKDLKYPLSTFGFSAGLNYKGFALSVVFYGVGQVSRDVDNNILWDLGGGNYGIYSSTPEVNQTWTQANALTAKKPVLHSDYGAYSMRGATTYSCQDASYVRLKNCELSYTFKNKALEFLKISKFQIYANGNNLLTFSNYNKNIDPEQGGTNVYPIVKSYTTGLRISF